LLKLVEMEEKTSDGFLKINRLLMGKDAKMSSDTSAHHERHLKNVFSQGPQDSEQTSFPLEKWLSFTSFLEKLEDKDFYNKQVF
jgi:hypothetical protein